jgi:hypothetical protein
LRIRYSPTAEARLGNATHSTTARYRILACCLVLATPAAGHAQTPARSEIESHVHFLTSPLLQGRRTGSVGADLAAHYVETRFRASGLKPAVALGDSTSFFQVFSVCAVRCDTAQSSLEWELHGRRRIQPVGSTLPCVPGSPMPVEGEAAAVFCGYGLEAPEYGFRQLPRQHVEGRVVVAVQGQPRLSTIPELRQASSSAKQAAAAASGAVAVVLIGDPRQEGGSRGLTRGRVRPCRGCTLEQLCNSTDMPPLFVMEQDLRDSVLGAFLGPAVELLDSIDAGADFAPMELPELSISFTVVPLEPDSLPACNVVGSVGRGTPCVLVGAHYDHLGVMEGELYPGADDNASGTAVLLEVARMLAACAPARGRFLFAAFGAEELGQLGSLYYCTHPVVPCDSMSLMICVDSVGRSGPDHYRHLGSPASRVPGRVFVYRTEPSQVLDTLVAAGLGQSDLTIEVSRSSLLRWGSDHWRFEDAGVPVLFYFSGIHEDYHRPSDTADKLDMTKLHLLVGHLCDILERCVE